MQASRTRLVAPQSKTLTQRPIIPEEPREVKRPRPESGLRTMSRAVAHRAMAKTPETCRTRGSDWWLRRPGAKPARGPASTADSASARN
eukprot:1398437-Alexandrium_andersonii.AAC.1